MLLSALDHCTIRTIKLAETRDFYVGVLGMSDGERPDFGFPGHWLYVDGKPVVHLVGLDPDDPAGLQEYLSGPIDAESLSGSGAFDHVAFRANDPDALIARIKAKGHAFRERKVPGMDMFQVFVADPNGVTVELNYAGGDRKAA